MIRPNATVCGPHLNVTPFSMKLLRPLATRSRASVVRAMALILGVTAMALVIAIAIPTGFLTVDDGPATPTQRPATAVAATPRSAAPTVAPDATPRAIPTATTLAAVVGASVAISDVPSGPVTGNLANPQPSGAPLVFRIVDQRDGWLQVQLPQRPNGRTGWITADAVVLSTTPYALVVSTSANTLTLFEGGVLQRTYTVATGTGGTPTPTGSYAITELLIPTNDGYGPFAYGLTAFSDVLTSFGGGAGQIGIHGTEDADSIGQNASHGCIRMRNEDISALAAILPLGTPVIID